MKILYISSTSSGMHSHGIYYDLFKELSDIGNDVTIAYARESRDNKKTALYKQDGMTYLGIKTLNMTKNKNMMEKGLAVMTIDRLFLRNIKKYLGEEDYDLVMYSTPPITFNKTLKYFQKKGSFLYLMLKDIFPQNGVDLELFSKQSLIYRYFRMKEVRLYSISNLIGVMSNANRQYLLDNNTTLDLDNKTILLPNSIKIKDTKKQILNRQYFSLKDDDFVLIYGGNLGLPQDVNYIKKCILELEKVDGVKFVICGSGSESDSLRKLIDSENISNTIYLGVLPTHEYNQLTFLSDLGLVFLDKRFTIPNYPQRLLSYLEAKIPVLCSTDSSTDIGIDAEQYGYGISLSSNNVSTWIENVIYLRDNVSIRNEMGIKGFERLSADFNVEKIAPEIVQTVKRLSSK